MNFFNIFLDRGIIVCFHLRAEICSVLWTVLSIDIYIYIYDDVAHHSSLSPATTQTAGTTAGRRMPWTRLHPSASSPWGWGRSTCHSTATTTTVTTATASGTPSATAPPRPQASPTLCRRGSVCALTLRRVASLSSTPTLWDLCGKAMWTAPAPCAQRSVSSAEGLCSCRNWSPIATQIRLRWEGSPSRPASPT